MEDVFEFTVFFVFFPLVLLEFLLCFRADYRRETLTSDAWRTNGVSERTPLLATSRESSQTLLPSETNQNKRVRLFHVCLRKRSDYKIVTAHKRSLRQGDVPIPVCLSTGGAVLSRGCCL